MAKDLFSSAPVNGKHYDLFGAQIDSFRWIVGVFSGNGATQTIIKANKCDLLTYYPIRHNKDGEPTPIFRNYLFVEFREYITIDLCRATTNFIKVLSAGDDDGLVRPMLVRRNAVDENRAMVMAGRFNERRFMQLRHYEGSAKPSLWGEQSTLNVKSSGEDLENMTSEELARKIAELERKEDVVRESRAA